MDNADVTKEAVVNVPEGQSDSAGAVKSVKKKFVTPEISEPVDVLEATTFFQSTTSGTVTPTP